MSEQLCEEKPEGQYLIPGILCSPYASHLMALLYYRLLGSRNTANFYARAFSLRRWAETIFVTEMLAKWIGESQILHYTIETRTQDVKNGNVL